MRISEKKFNTYLNIFIIVGMVASVVIANLLDVPDNIWQILKIALITVGAVMGVINMVLSANGNIWSFFFACFEVSICAYANWEGGNYGIFFQHIFFFLPMQFVGFMQWKKRGAKGFIENVKQVKARRLSLKLWILVVLGFILSTAAVYFISYYLQERQVQLGNLQDINKAQILLDSTIVVLNTIGQILLVFAFMEQWFFWNLVNLSQLVLWSIIIIEGDVVDRIAIIMLIKYSFYMLNSLNGLRIWFKLSKGDNCDNIDAPHLNCC